MAQWEKERLGNIATYVNGFAFKPSQWAESGKPIIRIQDLTGSSNKPNRYGGVLPAKYSVTHGDVLISWSASLGVFVWEGEDALLNQHIFKVVFDKAEVDKSYFVHQVSCVLRGAEDSAHGCTTRHLTKPVFDALPFTLPPLPEQKLIAEELDNICAAKKDAEAIVEKLKLLAKSQFVEMFGDPATNSHDLPVKQMGEILTGVDSGKSFVCESSPRAGNHPAVLKLSAVSVDGYKPDENKALPYVDLFVEKAEVKPGDLLFTRKNTPELVGTCAYVKKTPPFLMMPDLIFRLNPTEEVSKQYLCALINHSLFRPKIQNLASGSAKSMSNISKERLSKLKVPIPPLELQNEYAAFIERLDKSVFEAQALIGKLDLLYRAKLQEYFG